MRIDAHHHVWDLTIRDQPWTTIPDETPEMPGVA
jgi:predicted TIM-barrel fold metal-dependent hydrolase